MTKETHDSTDNDAPGPRAAPGVRRRLFWSFGVQSLAILLRIAQQVALVPILIKAWGTALYSDWITISSAVALLSMLDFGMQVYFGNAMLAAWSRQDLESYRRQIATAMGLYAIVISLACAALAGSALVLQWPKLLGTHALTPHAAMWTAGLLAASSLSLIPFGVVAAAYRARGDYGRGGIWAIMVEACRGFGLCVVALLGGTPAAGAMLYLAAGAAFWIAVLLDQRRLYGEVSLGIHFPAKSELRETMAGSALYMTTVVSAPIILNAPILLLGALASSPGAVVAFSVYRTFTGFVRQIVNQLSHPIGAELSRQEAIGDVAKLRRLFSSAGRLIAGSAGLLAGFTLIVAEPFIRIWTRGQLAYDHWLVAIFVLTIVSTAPAQVALMLFWYNNRPRVLVATYCTFALGTVLFCTLLIKGYSAAGAAAGAGIAEMLSIGILLPRAAAAAASAKVFHYLRDSYIVAAVAFALSYGVTRGIAQLIPLHSLASILGAAFAWAAFMALPAFFLLLAAPERRWVGQQLSLRLSRAFGLFRGFQA